MTAATALARWANALSQQTLLQIVMNNNVWAKAMNYQVIYRPPLVVRLNQSCVWCDTMHCHIRNVLVMTDQIVIQSQCGDR